MNTAEVLDYPEVVARGYRIKGVVSLKSGRIFTLKFKQGEEGRFYASRKKDAEGRLYFASTPSRGCIEFIQERRAEPHMRKDLFAVSLDWRAISYFDIVSGIMETGTLSLEAPVC